MLKKFHETALDEIYVEGSNEEVFSGRLLKVQRDHVTLPNGSDTTREYIRHPGAVAIVPVLEGLQTWTNESLYEALVALAAKLEVKNSVVLWPLRVAVSGKASTPGGATELCALLGKEESLARIRTGIELLSR